MMKGIRGVVNVCGWINCVGAVVLLGALSLKQLGIDEKEDIMIVPADQDDRDLPFEI